MKPMKVAAVVAGSMMALGAATPAFAADTLTPTSLNGGLDTLAGHGLREAKPLSTTALDAGKEGSLVHAVKGATDGLNTSQKGKLLGGIPLGK
ncbi:hypothetical protein ABZ707_09425 [Streptomyces sp. NPDC006923]|uniref:hypothetical protein n=1 Tax=Streptomyces sp. NPDC006923 TaxID=3155355 RepID=UPI0033CC1A54